MTQPKAPKAVSDDIPVDKAWKIGRRIYVRCGYQSELNTQLREIGASWDRDERALWVGSTKLAQVLPLLRAQAERVAKVDAVKAAGRWVTIPYDATDIRTTAKRLGGVYDGGHKRWAMPTDDAHEQVQTLLKARGEAIEAAKRVAEQEREEARRRAEQEQVSFAEARSRQIIEASGRHVVDEKPIYVTGHLQGHLNRPQAEQNKPQPGEVRRWKDGRRVLVLDCDVEFASQDDIDDGLSYADPWDSPGWYWRYEAVEVAPVAAEVDADHEAALWVDDYRSVVGAITDATVIARIEAVLAGGSRRLPASLETGGTLVVTVP